jgi:hypothetical protein
MIKIQFLQYFFFFFSGHDSDFNILQQFIHSFSKRFSLFYLQLIINQYDFDRLIGSNHTVYFIKATRIKLIQKLITVSSLHVSITQAISQTNN